MKTLLTTLLFLLGTLLPTTAGTIDYTARQPHPRLLMRAGAEAKIRDCLTRSPEMQRIYTAILKGCDTLLTTPTLTYQKIGFRLLAVSREALRRIFYLSFAYRMTGDDRYALRAEQEMVAVCSFSDWNPSHFLDVGEMTMAVAIGYDWLYDRLTPANRERILRAICDKGFAPSRDKRYNWFLRSTNNWNQVCNAGLVFGALAVLDQEEQQAIEIVERARTSILHSVGVYAPDGNYPEGYNYWGYGTTFNVLLIAALESALDTDCGLGSVEGFMESARYMEYMAGTTGRAFNYSDARETAQAFPAQFWFAAKANDPSLLWNELMFLRDTTNRFTDEESRFLPLALIYGADVDFSRVAPPAELMWTGGGNNPVALIRTDWTPGQGCYLGIKGGRANVSHGHMDAGSFVFEALGVRWAQDLGMQEYHSLEKEKVDLWNFGQQSQRWQVFRYNNRVHNTLTVNDSLHRVGGFVPIVTTWQTDKRVGAQLDLSELFGGDVKRAIRDITLVNGTTAEVTDRIEGGSKDARVVWTLCTSAEVRSINRRTLELTQSGKRLRLEADIPSDCRINVTENTPPHTYDAPNPNSRRITLEFTAPHDRTTQVRVRLVPQF
ncbi:heparinase II/III domain-containing protein [Millionella massiliensis]|uniref:heparinase II/III domain-containing protein n=1 Tax=Millionella massiliensis TaxID=1871023 RepID=UPI0024B678D6|nr:heparinase II/III family protein [Millionella massiliensis]